MQENQFSSTVMLENHLDVCLFIVSQLLKLDLNHRFFVTKTQLLNLDMYQTSNLKCL